MANLIDFFTPLFSYGLELQQKLLRHGQQLSTAEQIHQELLNRIRSAQERALQAGKREQDIQEATFAYVAWLDEGIAAHPEWESNAIPLQQQLFSTYNAGDEFFDHLQQLDPRQDEVREVYYMAMGLGFIGKFYFDTAQTGEFAKIKTVLGRQLPHAPASIHTLAEEHVTPQPYLIPDPPGPHIPSHWDKLLLSLGTLAALLVPLYFIFDTEPSPTPTPSPVKVDTPSIDEPIVEIVEIEPALRQLMGGFQCAELSSSVDKENTNVHWQGYVQSSEDLERLREETKKISGVNEVSSEVKVRIWPFCEAVEILAPYKNINETQFHNLQIATQNASARLKQGENITLELKGSDYQNVYIYVDYYQLDGTVVHMLPNQWEPDNFLEQREKLTFGLPQEGKPTWVVQPPFGEEMIAIMAVSERLEGEGWPRQSVAENAKNYFPILRNSVKEYDLFIADYLFIQTESK